MHHAFRVHLLLAFLTIAALCSAGDTPTVSKKQTIGLYATYLYFPSMSGQEATENHFGLDIVPTNKPVRLAALALGIRYFPWQSWMFDFAYLGQVEFTPDVMPFTFQGFTQTHMDSEVRGEGPNWMLTFNRVQKLSRRLSGIAGIGLMMLSLENNGEIGVPGKGFDPIIESYKVYMNLDVTKLRYTTPLLRLGIEWKPQDRVGLAILGNYLFNTPEFEETISIYKVVTDICVDESSMVVRRLSLPSWSLQAALSFYF